MSEAVVQADPVEPSLFRVGEERRFLGEALVGQVLHAAAQDHAVGQVVAEVERQQRVGRQARRRPRGRIKRLFADIFRAQPRGEPFDRVPGQRDVGAVPGPFAQFQTGAAVFAVEEGVVGVETQVSGQIDPALQFDSADAGLVDVLIGADLPTADAAEAGAGGLDQVFQIVLEQGGARRPAFGPYSAPSS